jgi:uncharacterized protein (DUF2126 family)/transglutaminase-like putative cysteine protease
VLGERLKEKSMAIRVALNHRTEYHFDRFVSLSPHLVRLWPAPHCRTPILSRSLRVTPKDHFINWQQDPYSNYLARFVFPKKTKELIIEVDLVADMTVINPFDFFIEPYAEEYPFVYEPQIAKELHPFFERQTPGPKLLEWLEKAPRGKMRMADFIVELNRRLHEQIKYIIRLEPGIQSVEETLTKRSGSCRDSAWLLVQIMRQMGLAARFASGYLIQLTADVKALDGPSGAETDFTDLHAWTEVYIPGAGWIGLDPTSGLIAGEGHIPLACTADPVSAGPVTGMTDECKTEMKFEMSVKRVMETPRVTKPYTEEQWQRIELLGHKIDKDLIGNDVRLTMGGEPTFVSIDHPNDEEWNTAAVGPNKRRLGGVLLKRLRDRFAGGALLHYGQGKWYPGEQLPRWSLGCYWRKDGEPIWRNPDLIADEAKKYGYTDNESQKFVTALAERLALKTEHAIPGYEDVWHYLLRERQLPVNVDPLASRLSDPMERKRLTKVFEQGLNKVVGYALPLQKRNLDGQVRWISGPWFLRREHMYLIPGDSPMGYRLPLESLPWIPEGEHEIYEMDPTIARPPLPMRTRMQQSIPGGAQDFRTRMRFQNELRMQGLPSQGRASEAEEAAKARTKNPVNYDVVRTALCVEARGGLLYVFMPPQRYLEDYLELTAAIEDTASDLRMPVLIEGYTPPHDSRVNVIKVTPDPGVIEVNIHPASNWDELVKNTQILYEEARLSRLATEKFMLDGRHTGTGGGNHIVVGGSTPVDSPMLRRPDVLKSLISYWHNHPSLSFLFSGLFIGPTSQHPRVDEARNDSVYELEMAFSQLPGPNMAPPPPWIVDRVLRNLLIDSTGNTHRTEFCIDKLFSPDSSTGRLGLVELRSFEMPPHYRMSLTQQLLLRALIGKFWRDPYKHDLVRWGTELHDRFMLPHFVSQDMNDVLSDLNDCGYTFDSDSFAPHLEFRFPLLGGFAQRGVQVEVRQAMEPWHVLGEENVTGGTARYVDSSLERVQVKVRGMTDSRHIATCNGRRVPLHPTGINGEYVAGVRYRAWQPPSCLQPLIGVHTPLIIDLFDTWNSRSIGGCTYHVSHPGGRSFETFPVNAYEAESRRVARFFVHGHTPGPMAVPRDERSAEFPFTLDLRAAPPAF